MKMISLFTEEVVYPLRYSQWYNDQGNGYDFASNDDLADLGRGLGGVDEFTEPRNRELHPRNCSRKPADSSTGRRQS